MPNFVKFGIEASTLSTIPDKAQYLAVIFKRNVRFYSMLLCLFGGKLSVHVNLHIFGKLRYANGETYGR